MPSSADGQTKGLSFSGFFRARVVKNDDPKLEGRVGVFIPTLITEMPDTAEEPSPGTKSIPTGLFANQDELSLPATVKTDNYIWARPCHGLVENGKAAGNHGGSSRVPHPGTMVTVFFEGEDPNRPYWLPFSTTIDGDVIGGTHLGKGTNVGEAAGNWKDAKKRTKIDVMAEYESGNVVYTDNNKEPNAFVVRMAGGHTLTLHDAKESGIVLETSRGHKIQLDENSTEIRIRTHTGRTSIVMNDAEGTITIHADTAIILNSPLLRSQICTETTEPCSQTSETV